MADDAPSAPAAAARRRDAMRLAASVRGWWRRRLVSGVDQEAVIERIRGDSQLSGRYLFMTLMAAGIAVLGMLQSSPAVVIGAMLLSPLMSPIIGSGFALAIGDVEWLRRCAKVLAVGTAMAIAMATLLVVISPLQTVTPEIAARTRPSLFDLGVALFSALAGSYAMIRGREGIIVGVAIATALIPPLAAVGFGLGTLNLKVFGGALMLFVTNLMAISLASAVMARIYGFQTDLTPKQTRLQTLGIIAAFTLLAVPLGFSLRQIAWESNSTRLVSAAVKDQFDQRARVSQLDIDFDRDPIVVSASVLTPDFRHSAETSGARIIGRLIGRPVILDINQYRVGTEAGAAEAAELANARVRQQEAAAARQIDVLSSSLALVAGVASDDVVIDRVQHHALVRARPIEGATLRTYRELEQRVAQLAPGWTVELVPPTRALPPVALTDGKPDPASLDLIAWAATRLGLAVELRGDPAMVEQVAEGLAARGLTDVRAVDTSSAGIEVALTAIDTDL